ncbi:phage tail protein [Peredibacter starrii]|uniref:Phage tail protein n=1 Tax=Peredibacter starrii TaxID=28202 RepID=A0AAX4HKM2_9BACT|nr:phage tail protein [Peredibacter starrii]WPU63776.1 phage tail protein [Peredibacter starrii]
MKFSLVGLLTVISLLSAANAESLSYSGRLVNTNGSPIVGPVNLRFDLASTADTSVVLCNQDINNVALTNGVFHVKLDLDCGTPTLSQVLASITTPSSPAIRVTNLTASKAYSFQELHAVPSAQVAHGLSKLNANNNEVLTWTGSKWEPKPIVGATGGTVTDITAGSGLSGGTITNSGTIAISNSGVTDSHLAGNISRSKLASGTPNYVLANNGSGVMSELAFLGLTQGGTGANNAADARTNLGLNALSSLTPGLAWNQALVSDLTPCMGTDKLTLTAGPTVTFACVPDVSVDNSKLPLAGGTMSGNIDMGTNKITNLAMPSAMTDAATKNYVDTAISGANSWTVSGSNIYNSNAGNVGIGATNPVQKLHVNGKVVVKPDFGTPNSPTADAVASFDREVGPVAINLFTSNSNTASVYFGDTATISSGAIKYYVHSGDPTTQQMDFFVNNIKNLSITGSGKVDVQTLLRLKSDNTKYITLRAPASLASDLSMSLPGTSGSSGQALITDGSGNLSWATVATGASAVGGDLSGTMSSATIINSAVTSAKIADGTIVDDDIAAGAAISQSKISGLAASFTAKENSITAGTTAQYWRGDKTWQTLNTSVVPEVTNLYYTDARVRAAPLTGLSTTAGVVSATDTVLQAIGKLTGNQTGFVAKTGDTMSGPLAMGNQKITGLGTPTAGTDAATKTYVDSKATQWITTGSDIYYNLGDVGVGTATPAAELHVVDSTDSQAYVRIDSARSVNGASTAVVEMNATASPAPANKKNFQIMNVNGTTGNQLTVMATNDDLSQKGKRVTITHDGDVAIGATAAPAAKLEVEGGVKIGNDSGTCNASKQGTMRFVGGNFEGCDGVSWVTMGSSTPAGQVATYAMSTCPSGWIKANGAAVSRTTYAGLFAAVGTTWGAGDGSTTFNLPDLRGEFVRGWDDGRGVDTGRAIASAQADDYKSHNHTGSSASAGDHAHTGTTSTNGNHTHGAWTSTDGHHGHSINALFPWDSSVLTTNDWSTDAILGTDNAPGNNGFRSTNQGTDGAGNHSHSVGMNGAGDHAHTFTTSTTGAHTHTVTVNASGGTETRPRNKALLYCIKY